MGNFLRSYRSGGPASALLVPPPTRKSIEADWATE